MDLPPPLAGRDALLIVAHPGHELRVHGWLELATPEVWVLTNGAGRTGTGRLGSSRAVIESAGARVGPVFGEFSDREAYRLLLSGDVPPVARLAEGLADRLEEGTDYVVSDALEGFNPVHDLCHVLVGAAAELVEQRAGRRVDSLDFPLEAAPDTSGRGGGDVRIRLDEAAVARKLAAARAYPEMAGEVARALAAHGPAAFAVERLRPVETRQPLAERVVQPPLYERYGEARVAAGEYSEVLRFAEHFAPFAAALTESLEHGRTPRQDAPGPGTRSR